MAGNSNIGWTNATWNPTRGCERVSPGCKKCYAEILAARHSYPGGWGEGLAKWVTRPDGTKEARWTGVMQMRNELLDWPLRRRDPSRIFVNSMSDLFHDGVPFEFVAAVFGVMALCEEHTFQLLTKRPDRMLAFFEWAAAQQNGPAETCAWHARNLVPLAAKRQREQPAEWPLPNVWPGVSVERQEEADERLPILFRVPGAIRWTSAEPLLELVDLIGKDEQGSALHAYEDRPRLDWVVVGGESGQDPRPMDIQHARLIIGQCRDAGVPVFVKQDGGARPGLQGRFTAEEWALKEYPA